MSVSCHNPKHTVYSVGLDALIMYTIFIDQVYIFPRCVSLSLHYTGFEMKGDGGGDVCSIAFILIRITLINIVVKRLL